MKFEIGDRVRVYDTYGAHDGTVSTQPMTADEKYLWIVWDKKHPADGSDQCRAHPKQCRKLVKKKRREWLLLYSEILKQWEVYHGHAVDLRIAKHLIRVREVKK